MTLLVRGGTVVTAQGTAPADVVVEGQRIVAVTAAGRTDPVGAEVVDAGGLLVLPGLVDGHVHFDEPGRTEWEGFDSGSAACVAGGVTTVVDMPIDCDPPTVTAAAVAAKVSCISRHSRVDVALWGGLVPHSIDAMPALAAAGVAGFKAFACPSGWEDFPPVDEATLTAGMARAAALGLPVAVHCELASLGHTVASEVAALNWAARAAAGAGARLHAVHLSSAAGVDAARRWPGVTTETCPHYLTLDPGEPDSHCFPPLRGPDERAALWSRVLDGGIDSLASDHSPCPPALRASWAGIDGAGMTLPVLLSDGRLPLGDLIRLATESARILRLVGKGAIAPGFDADLVLFDPAERWMATRENQWSRHRRSPYSGRTITGRVVCTLVRGREVYSVQQGISEAGGGRFLRPG